MSLCHLSAVSAHSGRKIAYTSTAEMSICGYDVTYSLVRMFFTLEYLVGLFHLSYSRCHSVLDMFVLTVLSCSHGYSFPWLHDSWLFRHWTDYSDTGLIIQTLDWLFRHWTEYSDTGLIIQTLDWVFRHWTDYSDTGLIIQTLDWVFRHWTL